MIQISLENEYGNRVDLFNNKDYELVHAEGLNPARATLNIAKMAIKDGGKFNSSTLNERNIVLTIRPKRNIEENRLNIYKIVRPKRYIKVYLKTNSRDVYIEGYVDIFDVDLFAEIQLYQISIICPDPYFKMTETLIQKFSAVKGKFTFPVNFTSDGVEISEIEVNQRVNIYNPGDDDCGLTFDIYAVSLALEPTIHNLTTGKHLTINHEFNPGDIVRISTGTNEKSITLIREGIETNIFNQMDMSSNWLTLMPGDNYFTYSAVAYAQSLQVTAKVQPVLTGV